MEYTIFPRTLSGTVSAIASKSIAHRLLICAALAGQPEAVCSPGISKDVEATKACLKALQQPGKAVLPCGESGSTLRFMLPIAAALGREADFLMEGRLPQRPMTALEEQLTAHGLTICRPEPSILHIEGRLTPGDYVLPGNVSSQFVTGLLFALPLLEGPSVLHITGTLESASYVELTLEALARFGVQVQRLPDGFAVEPQSYTCPGAVSVEGDWSNAAFWLCAGAVSGPVTMTGLRLDSLQGDRKILDLLEDFGAVVTRTETAVTVQPGTLRPLDIDVTEIPDLAPILSIVAAACPGRTRIYGGKRLRFKESDRIEAVCRLLKSLGAQAEETEDGLIIHGGKALTGGTADSVGDHRIAMSAAIGAALCQGPVTVLGAEAVGKSDPKFWEVYETMKGSAL